VIWRPRGRLAEAPGNAAPAWDAGLGLLRQLPYACFRVLYAVSRSEAGAWLVDLSVWLGFLVSCLGRHVGEQGESLFTLGPLETIHKVLWQERLRLATLWLGRDSRTALFVT